MTLEKARELIRVQADMRGGDNRSSARLMLAEVEREHGQNAVDRMIREFDLESIFAFCPDLSFATKEKGR